jgi:hypothetical protein
MVYNLATNKGQMTRSSVPPGAIRHNRALYSVGSSAERGGYEAGRDRDKDPGVPGATGNIQFYGCAAPLAPGMEDRRFTALRCLLKQ